MGTTNEYSGTGSIVYTPTNKMLPCRIPGGCVRERGGAVCFEFCGIAPVGVARGLPHLRWQRFSD